MAISKKRMRSNSAKPAAHEGPATKKVQLGSESNGSPTSAKVNHAVLSQYFPNIVTLRNWILSKLPESSKTRRRKIAAIGSKPLASKVTISDVERSVGSLLDTTLVGVTQETKSIPDKRWEEWTSFSQRGDESYDVTLSDGLAGSSFSQSEIVDFAIWFLFSKASTAGTWPSHLLCDGFRQKPGSKFQTSGANGTTGIPGIYSVYPNQQYKTLKLTPWPELLKLLGKAGDRIMMDLLLDCSIFVAMNAGQDNYYQVNGQPLFNAELLQAKRPQDSQREEIDRSLSDISFLRSRILYARAALNARGLVHFGLRHIHILNRAPYMQPSPGSDGRHVQPTEQNDVNTLKVLMYIFPRQFGLHNAFTSKVDFKETSQRLKDYTLREQEIIDKFGVLGDDSRPHKAHIPKRLRGKAKDLVQRLQVLHMRCSYSKLLEHYCPVRVSNKHAASSAFISQASVALDHKGSSQVRLGKTKKSSRGSGSSGAKSSSVPQSGSIQAQALETQSLMDLATPMSQVSAFCQSVVLNIVPNELWGHGSVLEHNKGTLLKNIDQFIRLRRFESMSLHEVMQGMKITEIEWLAPPKLMTQKTSQTDIRKRVELFCELLYYIFDSILIPLIRSNFYVTESNAHKYRLFFFRHDVWRYTAESAISSLKVKMFEEVSLNEANRILDSRDLGFSQVRLLPKTIGIRTIMNLRRRTVTRGNQKVLGPSINNILGPVHTVLQLEKYMNPAKLGSTMFSVGDIYNRIKSFKSSMKDGSKPFYFAKVDVQSAFDTIPQSAIVGLLNSIPQQSKYLISKHAEIATSKADTEILSQVTRFKPSRKWHSTATHIQKSTALFETLRHKKAANKRNTIFIDSVVKKQRETNELLQLVASHIQQNLVKIGKKFYRQKEGIPQGSVLSSTLCNYFYADLEMQVLPFLASEDCLLLRLIDDFLLITMDKEKAVRFVKTMHHGVPEYGVSVSEKKTLVNFDMTVDGHAVARVAQDHGFPYCGTMIDCKTLDITRNKERNTDQAIYDSLTIDFTRTPGQTFQRKVMNAFKIQSHMIFFDTSLNSLNTTLANIFNAFSETATKMWAYARCLSQQKQPAPLLIIRTISKLVEMAYLLLNSKRRKSRFPGYQCDVKKSEVAWLAHRAFLNVLGKRQSKYGTVINWLKEEMWKLESKKDMRLDQVRNGSLRA